jgi:signal transduction histidine kinase
MKIQKKITLIFVLLTGSLLVFVFGFIYFFSYRFTRQEFYQQLNDRASIIGRSYLEKDELSPNAYDEIVKRHWQKLPGEDEALIRIDTANEEISESDTLERIPEHFFDKISEKNHIRFFDEIVSKSYAFLQSGDTYYAGLLYIDNQGNFMVVASAKNVFGEAKMRNLAHILIAAFLVGLMAIYIIGRYYAGKVLKPISDITSKAKEISLSNLHLRLDISDKKDELDELALTFNNMLERLETDLEVQTNFVSNASHELRNPLTAILGEAEVALNRERSAREYIEFLSTIENEAQRLDLLVSNLLNLAQTGSDKRALIIEPVRVDELLQEVKLIFDINYPKNKIVIDYSELPDDPDMLVTPGNPSLLKVALSNIIDNACKFSMNKEVKIKISVKKNYVEIVVKDNGVGISESDLKNITMPFFRASNARSFKGSGIGLPLAQKIIRMHSGKMDISSEVMKGTEVILSFPHISQTELVF